MRDENESRTLSSNVDVGADGGAAVRVTLDISRSLRSVAYASERAGRLVKRAMMLLESDRRAALRYLKEASALLGSEPRDSASSVPVTSSGLQPGGLAGWQTKRALEHIEVNLESKLDIDELANLVGISKSHFSRAFKRSLGLSPMAYVTTRRVERAKVMMTQTREQLTEIALACGCTDQSHLNRLFSRMVGVSPGRWRRTNAATSCSPPLRKSRQTVSQVTTEGRQTRDWHSTCLGRRIERSEHL